MIDALAYRIAARALFAPFGGLATMRRRAVDGLGIRPGSRVLELGYGDELLAGGRARLTTAVRP